MQESASGRVTVLFDLRQTAPAWSRV